MTVNYREILKAWEEESSRVVTVYDSFGRLKNAYLYLSKSDMKDYVREKFEL